MATIIRAQWNDMRQAANDVANTVSQMDNEMATWERTMMATYETWDGPARNAFDEARVQWKAIQRDLHTRLAQVGQAVSGSAAEFENAELSTARSTPGVIAT
jgi:WXG100 family type VII secretion target